MKDFTNKYTFVFSLLLAVVIAVLLTVAAIQLQPFQNKNIEIEKKRFILSSLNIPNTVENAESLYAKHIIKTFVLDISGKVKPGIDAFSVNLKAEMDKPVELRNLPVFVGITDDSIKAFVFPLLGKGLWGPISGYISLREDMNTVFGIVFDHKGETPGLGAEIVTPFFQGQFKGKKLFDDKGDFVCIKVMKSGSGKNNIHQVDALSGATITSTGVQDMLLNCLKNYVVFFKQGKK